jgi:pyruvate-formate lyase
LPHREQDRFEVRDEDINTFFKEIVPYWRGNTLEDKIKEGKEGTQIKETEKVLKINQKDHAQGHIIPDVQEWINVGPLVPYFLF